MFIFLKKGCVLGEKYVRKKHDQISCWDCVTSYIYMTSYFCYCYCNNINAYLSEAHACQGLYYYLDDVYLFLYFL